MSLRKALAYSKKKARPYTRNSKRKNQAYIKVLPQNKIAKFHLGSQKDFRDGKHEYIIRFISEERVQIRDNAIEACRMYLTKLLDENALGQYYLAVKVYPHHLLRDNKTAAGAGADRLSTGMSHSFGIVVGRAAIVNPGKEIFMISCANEKIAQIARDALIQIKPKVPCKVRIVFEKIDK